MVTKRSGVEQIRMELWKNKYLYLLALPGLIYFFIFKFIPIGWLPMAFQNYSPYLGILKSEWVGFEHFARFFGNEDFIILLRNTLAISFFNLLFFFPLPIILALMLNELKNMVFKRFVQSIIYIPHFLSWVIIYGLTYLMLSKSEGLINKIIAAADFARIDFLTTPNFFWGLVTAQVMWKEAGWGTIIFLAAISGVDQQLYEAAKVDGAGRFRQMWHITLPAIRNVIIILFILQLGSVLDTGFEQIYLMTNGAVSQVADVFDTYVFRVGIKQGQFSYSAAIGLFKSIVGIILIFLVNYGAKRSGEEGVF
ncbi:ABC transporter permease subunit [Paenibacillus sp. N1-5-1-14]|uniref:ABC transporter permease n=1 Tax=Paenibacillus radicibacter TaxID=2972488 RepID=UPI002158BD7A|nr:ABC transporter permease subunit [Paenibacillus radicibacter]MCR8643071.1 ABC transporter permease subunit [Paenibacillus radicibacter]